MRIVFISNLDYSGSLQAQRRIRVLYIFGTRPEAIKLAPVILLMQRRPELFEVRTCATAQHREMLDQVLAAFSIGPDHDLDVMQNGQTLFQSSSRIIAALESVLAAEKPDMVMVQGDTTTTFCGALAAFYARVPVGHVEAGLRTWDVDQPFPEEINRVLTTRLSRLHFAATRGAADNLKRDGVPEANIHITGNSGIDAVLHVRNELEADRLSGRRWNCLDAGKKTIAVTAHRRESFGEGFERICRAIARLVERPDVQIVYPIHPNPNVQRPVRRVLSGLRNVHLIEPLDYVSFVDLMRRSYVLLTDSGGVQEEAPSLGKPVLVMRDKTERPEGVDAGTATLTGTDEDEIVRQAALLLDDAAEYERRSQVRNPYGDGHASERISEAVLRYFGN